MSTRGRMLAAVLCATLASAPFSSVVADPSAAEIAAAHKLFEDGLALEEKGDWAGALERFRKVMAVKATPQVRFHVALCLENVGKLVDALVEFQRARSDAQSDAGAKVVATSSTKHIDRLEERIPRVIVKVPSGVDGVTVAIDGAPVAASLMGTALPLDPGKHKIVVQAPKHTTFTRDVDLAENGKTSTVEVTLPAEGTAQPPPQPVQETETKPEVPSSSGPGALPWVVGAIGVAALAGGGAFYLMRQSTIRELEDACGPSRDACPESKRDVADKGKTYTTVGNVLLGVGVLGLATATVLFVVAPSSSRETSKSTTATRVLVNGNGSGFGLSLTGTF